MSILDSPKAVLITPIEDPLFDEAQAAAAAYLARYSGRTLDAYCYDLRTARQATGVPDRDHPLIPPEHGWPNKREI